MNMCTEFVFNPTIDNDSTDTVVIVVVGSVRRVTGSSGSLMLLPHVSEGKTGPGHEIPPFLDGRGLGSSVGRARDSWSGGPGLDNRCGRPVPTGWFCVSIM